MTDSRVCRRHPGRLDRATPSPDTPAALYVHEKLILIDGTSMLVGSQNATSTSLNDDRELSIMITALRDALGPASRPGPPATAARPPAQPPATSGQGIDLPIGPHRQDLRPCLSPGCVLYFIKNHPRREWCSAGCGNRARVARQYRRHHGDVPDPSGVEPSSAQRELVAVVHIDQ